MNVQTEHVWKYEWVWKFKYSSNFYLIFRKFQNVTVWLSNCVFPYNFEFIILRHVGFTILIVTAFSIYFLAVDDNIEFRLVSCDMQDIHTNRLTSQYFLLYYFLMWYTCGESNKTYQWLIVYENDISKMLCYNLIADYAHESAHKQIPSIFNYLEKGIEIKAEYMNKKFLLYEQKHL